MEDVINLHPIISEEYKETKTNKQTKRFEIFMNFYQTELLVT